jgi:MFS family permease
VKLWTKNYVAIAVVNFFAALNFYLLMIIVSQYAIGRFHSSTSQAGFAASIFILGALIARIVVGRWIARIGSKRMLMIGVLASVIMSVAYFGATGIGLLFIVRLLHGAAFGVTSTSAATIVADIVPAERRGEGIGYFSLSQTLATAIGPFIGILLSRSGNYTMIFIACVVVAAVSLVTAPLLSLPRAVRPAGQPSGGKFRFSSFIEPHVVPIGAITLLVFVCYSSVVSFLTGYAYEIDLVSAAGFFFVVYAAAVLLTRPFVGRLFDIRGENPIMYVAIPVFALGMGLFSQVRTGWMLLAAAAVIGGGYGAVQSTTQSIAVKITPPERMGLANSTYFMMGDLGMGIGPLAVGFLIPGLGYRGMYLLMAVLVLVSVALYHFLHGRKA